MNMARKFDVGDLRSNSDQEIFNSFLMLSIIKKETFENNSLKCSKDKIVSSIAESSSINFSSNNEDSAYVSPGILHKNYLKISDCIVPDKKCHFDYEYNQVTHNLLALCRMFDVIDEQIKEWQMKCKSIHEDDIKKAENIISLTKFRQRLTWIDSVLEHVYKISEKISKLKHLFRSNDQNKYLNIKIEYHKYVLDFFNMTQEIASSLNEDLQNVENCICSEERELAYEEFYRMIQKLTLELHKSVDTFKEFRNLGNSNII